MHQDWPNLPLYDRSSKIEPVSVSQISGDPLHLKLFYLLVVSLVSGAWTGPPGPVLCTSRKPRPLNAISPINVGNVVDANLVPNRKTSPGF